MHLEADRAAAARDALDLCLYQISQQLTKTLHKVIVVAGPEAYLSWAAYAAAFVERGGVVEACASGMAADCFEISKSCAVLCCAVTPDVVPSRAVSALACQIPSFTWNNCACFLNVFSAAYQNWCVAGVIGSPSVNLFIDPLGGVRLISSHEQMFCPPYRVIGSSFPQSSVPPVPLTEAALAVGRACYDASKCPVCLMHGDMALHVCFSVTFMHAEER